MADEVDISENRLLSEYPEEVLATLLRCHSSFDAYRQKLKNKSEAKGHEDDFHIIWATNDYEKYGDGYNFHDKITTDKITGPERGLIIRPRAVKSAEQQSQRSKDMAEVFTPTWICNAQNNLVDEAWFGRKDVFNREYTDSQGCHLWQPTEGKILFPDIVDCTDAENTKVFEGTRSWQAYVKDQRLEITCGEGPYLVSRYDAVSGQPIESLDMRIGILDRKLRVVSENVDDKKLWTDWAKAALQATYGYEWQGDNLLLAREAVFMTVMDYHKAKFGKDLRYEPTLKSFAYIISWNLWQMDGLKMVVPDTCHDEVVKENTLFEGVQETVNPCKGCKTGEFSAHNGIKCRIRDWNYTGSVHDKQRPFFYTLLKTNSL